MFDNSMHIPVQIGFNTEKYDSSATHDRKYVLQRAYTLCTEHSSYMLTYKLICLVGYTWPVYMTSTTSKAACIHTTLKTTDHHVQNKKTIHCTKTEQQPMHMSTLMLPTKQKKITYRSHMTEWNVHYCCKDMTFDYNTRQIVRLGRLITIDALCYCKSNCRKRSDITSGEEVENKWSFTDFTSL